MSLTVATRHRGRRLAAASLIAAAALSLTACQNGDDKASAAPSASSGSQDGADGGSTTTGGSSTGGSKATGGSSTGGSSTGGSASGGSASGGSSSGASSTGASSTGGQQAGGGSGGQGGASTGRKGVSGTWVGTLQWLTEDKLTVAPKSGAEQAFFLADNTKVLGAVVLCEAPDGRVHADGSGYGTTPCTLADLRKAAKLGGVEVRVTVAGGAATKVVEHYRQ
ncbi:hypothetical protein ACTPOK_25515 [Streptomyces inhibens]|uniref:hypothetical protein n=1 Tax=Streptomyces inhibens TaxID=2293571 RepID=UPI00402AD003